jgi:hypothetical protein
MSTGAFSLSDVDKPAGGMFSAADVEPKKYFPGRQFGMEVAKGLGLDAEKIKAAEDKGGQGEGLKEIGNQVMEGLTHFVGSVVKDPFNAVKPIEGAATNFENAVKSGSPGQIVGAVASILGGAKGASKAAEVAGGARESIGTAIHTAEGDLTPGAALAGKIASGAAGAAAGSTVGHEYFGAAVGYKLGPSLLDKIFPESQATAAARDQAAAYLQRAEDLMRRGKEQEALDRKVTAAVRLTERQQAKIPDWKQPSHEVVPQQFGAATPTSGNLAPWANAQLPAPAASATTASGAIQQGSPMPFVSKFTEPVPSRIAEPNSAAPPINKTLVSYSRLRLVEMAKGGDLDALRELIRNPGGIDVKSAVPNSRYLIEANRPTAIYGGPQQ